MPLNRRQLNPIPVVVDEDEAARQAKLEEAEHSEEEENRGGGVASLLESYSQRLSRRSMIQRVAAALLGSVAAAVFIEPTALAHQANLPEWNPSSWHNCTTWDRCYMCGYSCNCCNGTAGANACPSCAGQDPANSWVGCCYNTLGVLKKIRYIDCDRSSCTDAQISACYLCSGCNNACADSFHGVFWKGPNQTYVCTAVVHLGAC